MIATFILVVGMVFVKVVVDVVGAGVRAWIGIEVVARWQTLYRWTYFQGVLLFSAIHETRLGLLSFSSLSLPKSAFWAVGIRNQEYGIW